jgi:hypothetical protein
MPNKTSTTAQILFKNRLIKYKFARLMEVEETLETVLVHNAAPARFLARIGFPMRAIAILQTVKTDSLLKFLTRIILKNNILAYAIVQAWMEERDLYFISAEQ